ncbi:hypothetical protein SteCoe_1002 [Stentor coeruleus]|uniref:Lipid-binding serum glycoprotein C-terminal domain-containing protein n=1 Tax=Stentor coeruleus TaxID=5963 RepID=A0A1R2D2W0_9CILI|nr:hypothetical protein SteCoe_1002 [Stentor coeruleus]
MKLVVLIFLILSSLVASYPGIRTSLSMSSLNEFLQAKLPKVVSEVLASKIPDIKFSKNFLGIPISLKLSKIEISTLSIDTSNAEFTTTDQGQLLLTLPHFNLLVEGIYTYYIPFPISEYFNITMIDCNVVLPTTISTLKNGLVQVKVSPLEGDLSTLTIDIIPKNTISTIWVTISHLWPLSIYTNKVVVNLVDSISTRLNPYLEKFFNSIKYTDQIGKLPIVGDYHFFNIDLTKDTIEAEVNGTFFLINAPGQKSNVIPPSTLPDIIGMAPIRVQFTEYYFDSLMWALYFSGGLSFYIKSEDMPDDVPYVFTTTGLSKIAPNLPNVYGQNIPVDLQCSVYKVPVVTILQSVYISASVNCNFIVRISSINKVTAFTVISQLNTRIEASIKNQNGGIYVIPSLDNGNTDFTDFSLINSKIGSFSLSKMISAFNYYVYAIVLDANNFFESSGMILPLPEGLQAEKVNFNTYIGGVEIDFDPVFVDS